MNKRSDEMFHVKHFKLCKLWIEKIILRRKIYIRYEGKNDYKLLFTLYFLYLYDIITLNIDTRGENND